MPVSARTQTRTIVIVDLVKFTAITQSTEQYGGSGATLDVIKQVRTLVERALTACGEPLTSIVKSTGDGQILTISSPSTACLFYDALRELANREINALAKSQTERRDFRVAAATGDCTVDGSELGGNVVNVAARLVDAVEPWEFAMDEPSLALLRPYLREQFSVDKTVQKKPHDVPIRARIRPPPQALVVAQRGSGVEAFHFAWARVVDNMTAEEVTSWIETALTPSLEDLLRQLDASRQGMKNYVMRQDERGVVSFVGPGANVLPLDLERRLRAQQGDRPLGVGFGLQCGEGVIATTGEQTQVVGRVVDDALELAMAARAGDTLASIEYMQSIPSARANVRLGKRVEVRGTECWRLSMSVPSQPPTKWWTIALDKYFRLHVQGTSASQELLAGLTTFLTMSYIIFVQPAVLSHAGLDRSAVMWATCITAALACILGGLLAKLPIAIAPGMGENLLFVATAGALGSESARDGRSALMVTGLAALLLLGLALARPIREALVSSFSASLKSAIVCGVGLLVIRIGLQWAGIVVPDKDPPFSQLGPLHERPVLAAIAAVLVGIVVQIRWPRGATICAIVVGAFLASLIDHPAAETSSAPKIELTWSAVASGFSAHPGIIIGHALSLALLAFFDSAATVLAVRSQLGRVDERRTAARSGRVLAAAGTSSVIGSVLGTSMLVPYVESTAGVLVGGRTGLTAIICGLLFVAALFMGHVVELFGAPIPLVIAGHAEPIAVYPAIAAPLMLVGIAMLQQARFVQWSVWYESIPAVLTMAVTGFSASIPHGIAFGVVSYVLLNLVSDPKRVRVPLGVCALFFILWLALS